MTLSRHLTDPGITSARYHSLDVCHWLVEKADLSKIDIAL